MAWRSRIYHILLFQNLLSFPLKNHSNSIVNKTFTIPKICPKSQALGDIQQFLMKNKMCFIINYFNFVLSILAFFASIMDCQGIIVKIIDIDTIFISHM